MGSRSPRAIACAAAPAYIADAHGAVASRIGFVEIAGFGRHINRMAQRGPVRFEVRRCRKCSEDQCIRNTDFMRPNSATVGFLSLDFRRVFGTGYRRPRNAEPNGKAPPCWHRQCPLIRNRPPRPPFYALQIDYFSAARSSTIISYERS